VEPLPNHPGTDLADQDTTSLPAVVSSGRTGVILALVSLSMVLLFARLHTFDEPLERDITTYALIAHELIAGKSLYSELWDHKPPAIHATYAVAERLAGYGRNSILLMNMAAAMATLLACYYAGTVVTGKRSTGLLAAAIWTVICGELGLEANQPNTEVFINAFLTGGFALLLRMPAADSKSRVALLAGLLFGIASLYKQVAVVPVAFLCFVHLAMADRTNRSKAFADVAHIGLVGALMWGLVFGYFTAVGHVDAFIDAIFIYNGVYAGNFTSNVGYALGRPPLPFSTLMLLGSLAIICFGGSLFATIRAPRRPWILLVAFFLGCHVAVLLPGQFFAHYYQLWLPPLAIGSAWTVSLLMPQPTSRSWPWLRHVASVGIVAALIAIELPSYLLPSKVWSFRKYGSVFIESDAVAGKLASMLRPNETFYEWGNETGLYYNTKQDPPSGVAFVDPLLVGPLQSELWERVASDLQRTRPDVVVLESSTVIRTPASHPILRWIRANYRAISRDGSFLMVARKGSRIERKYAPKAEPPRA
jgi:4-amino-4-deoxy-L-arabinose transferase-like glycosyltransferase